jgi:hypothetical protein
MKQVIARGRQMGKSNLQEIMIKQQATAMQKSIDKMIIDEVRGVRKYHIWKSWRDRRGRQMHRIGANNEVREWLEQEHSQHGVHNPEWWKLGIMINITDRLFTLLTLKWTE